MRPDHAQRRNAARKVVSRLQFPIDHDYHFHSTLSRGCGDPACTPQAIFELAAREGYSALCLADQLWDPDVPGCKPPYDGQTPAKLLAARSFAAAASDKGLRCLVGCETEYAGGTALGLTAEHFSLFDFVVIPPNHMHLKGFVRPEGVDSPAAMAELFTRRLEELSALPIPMEKVGVAHLTGSVLYGEGQVSDVLRLMDEGRLYAALRRFAERGAGIELNADAFREMDAEPELTLWPYRVAKRAGCRFYCASDAHKLVDFYRVRQVLPAIVDALGLTRDDLYTIP